jgi:hypothetical protein
MRLKTKLQIAIIMLAGLFLASPDVLANVIAYDVQVQATSISYRLISDASAVNVEVFGPLPATTTVREIPGGTSKGKNTIYWDRLTAGGEPTYATQTFGIRITATDNVGHATWSRINDLSNLIYHFENPRGLAVNKNNGSENFGKVYVAIPRDGTTATGRAVQNGLYAMYPDGYDFLSQGDTAIKGGVAWVGTGNSSPYHLFVDSIDQVWIADWSDGHGGLWRANANLSGSFTQIFDHIGDVAGVANGVHGSISGVWVEGSGASTVLYWQDEDLLSNYSIWKAEIGDGPFPYSQPAEVVINEASVTTPPYGGASGLFNNCSAGIIVRDSTGDYIVGNYRSAGTDLSSLYIVSATSNALEIPYVKFGSLPDCGSPDPLRGNTAGAVLDESRGILVTGARENGFFVIPYPLPPASEVAAQTIYINIGSVPRCIDLDAAGNIYLASNISEKMVVYSPPGPNSFTTETAKTIVGGPSGVTGLQKWSDYR